MTDFQSNTGDASVQAGAGPQTGPPLPPPDPYSGQIRALCVSTCKVLGLDLGVFVRQLHHLLTLRGGRNIDGHHWTYQTHDELADMFPWWSKWQIRDRILKEARKSGVLVTRRQQHGGQLFRLDYELLTRLFEEVHEPLPDWLLDASFDPPVLDGRQGELVNAPEGADSINRGYTIYEPDGVKDSDSAIYEPNDVKHRETTTLEHSESTTSHIVKTRRPSYTERTTETTSEEKLASSKINPISEEENPWERSIGVGEEPQTFLERVWARYCDDYDENETIGLDDGKWRPLQDRILQWQRTHQTIIDPSRAEQIFDAITTRNPREPIGLIFAVFRDSLANRHDLDTPYEPPSRAGLRRMAGRY